MLTGVPELVASKADHVHLVLNPFSELLVLGGGWGSQKFLHVHSRILESSVCLSPILHSKLSSTSTQSTC